MCLCGIPPANCAKQRISGWWVCVSTTEESLLLIWSLTLTTQGNGRLLGLCCWLTLIHVLHISWLSVCLCKTLMTARLMKLTEREKGNKINFTSYVCLHLCVFLVMLCWWLCSLYLPLSVTHFGITEVVCTQQSSRLYTELQDSAADRQQQSVLVPASIKGPRKALR